ncbi:MAG: DUF6488 family protein [bacterium]|nr:DUF6488 family protein [bacterium]
MKKLFSTLAIVTILFSAAPSFGHGDHVPSNPISENAVLEQSMKDLAIIVDNKEEVEGQLLDDSWKDAKDPSFADKGKGYYVVSVTNEKANKTVYLLMADSGEFYDANFTGKFKGVAAD